MTVSSQSARLSRAKVGFWVILTLLGSGNGLYLWYSPYDLAGDEAYYWEWSRRPAICYHSKGPMVAYVIYASTRVFGNTTFAVRLPAALFSAGTLLLLYFLSQKIFRGENGASIGLLATLLLAASPMINLGGSIMTVDVLLCFFAAAVMVFLWQATEKGSLFHWALAGVCICLAILSKFTGIFLIPALFGFLLLSRPDRHWLWTIRPYLCCAIGLLGFFPVLIWNLSHGFETFRHIAAEGAGMGGAFLEPRWTLHFLGTQALVITPPLFLLIFLPWVDSLKRAISQRPHLFLQSFACPVFMFYLALSLHTRILPNWPVMGYFPVYLAASALLVEKMETWRESNRSRFLAVYLCLCILLGFAVSCLGRFPSLLCALRIPPKYHPTNRLIGWSQLGQRVSHLASEMGGLDNVFIFSHRYQIAAELAFYVSSPHHPITYCAPRSYRRLNQYDFWPGCNELMGKNAIYVDKKPSNSQYGETKVREIINAAFANISEAPPFKVRQCGEVVQIYQILCCYGFRGFHEDGKDRHRR